MLKHTFYMSILSNPLCLIGFAHMHTVVRSSIRAWAVFHCPPVPWQLPIASSSTAWGPYSCSMMEVVKRCIWFFFHVYQCFACMCYMYECAPSAFLVPRETRKGQQYALELESQALVAMCGLGTKAESPAWTASSPNH